MTDSKFCVEYAKRGQASCKKCKQKIEKSELRIGKSVPNPFSDSGGDMKQWFHVPCIFDQLSRARATTKKIDDPGDLDGWEVVSDDDKQMILEHIRVLGDKANQKTPKNSPKAKPVNSKPSPSTSKKLNSPEDVDPQPSTSSASSGASRVDTFRLFRKVCANLSEVGGYTEKTRILEHFFKKGSNNDGFTGDLYLWIKMLLPGVSKRVYNVQSKQLIKLFSEIFETSQEEMLEDLEQGDVAETVRIFFDKSTSCVPLKKSVITMQEVDSYLESLMLVTKGEDQIKILRKLAKRCTGNDLKMVVRLIKHDLRINCGPKHVLEALHSSAYEAFQASRDLKDVVARIVEQKNPSGMKKQLSVRASLMTPVLPMLAEPCRSVDFAFKRCVNGMYAEIKYDGERVQLHKQGDEFNYFSRSLKPVLPHKVAHLKDYIPRAFPYGNDMILDSEVLMIDSISGKPLPFGTLGKHKKEAFKDANVCLFVFDCIHYNGENLMSRPLSERRKILVDNMKEVENHVVLSEMTQIKKREELQEVMDSVFSQGLEGLVLKDVKGIYEPGKRHWLKVKKDYLQDGAMADSADLAVLGAYFGTGNKGGIMSVFLMGCWDPHGKKWCTVTKVHGGHDDATLDRLQKELKMTKISKDYNRVPAWLSITRQLVPDFICRDPKETQIWEISGAEFTKSEIHTADGISIRFPRVTRIRHDKSWKEATNLTELHELFKKSKVTTDFKGIRKTQPNSDTDGETTDSTPSPAKKHAIPSPNSPSPKKIKFSGNDVDPQDIFKTNPNPEVFVDVFTGVKLYLNKCTPQYDLLMRYFIAYDGEFLTEHEMSQATHIVTDARHKGLSSKAFVVSADWLWDCIKLKRLLPTGPYVLP